VDRARLTRFGELHAEGAGLEPDPVVMPDMVGINHLEHPDSFNPPTGDASTEIGEKSRSGKLAHSFFTSV
jgi:hypothetical protein